MIVSAPPHLRTSAMLRGYDPCFQPRAILFFHLFSDILLLDDSPLLPERRWTFQSGRPIRCAANENEGSILVVRLLSNLDAPANGSLSLASHGDRNHPIVLILIEHWRPGDRRTLRKMNGKWIYKIISRTNVEGIRRTDED